MNDVTVPTQTLRHDANKARHLPHTKHTTPMVASIPKFTNPQMGAAVSILSSKNSLDEVLIIMLFWLKLTVVGGATALMWAITSERRDVSRERENGAIIANSSNHG